MKKLIALANVKSGPIACRRSETMRCLLATFALVILGLATGAQAQSYVAGAIGAEVARAGSNDGMTDIGTGEAMSFSLRIGAPVAQRFGVELDFTRPSTIERDASPDIRILAGVLSPVPGASLSYSVGSGGTLAPSLVYPDFTYRVHTTQRITTVTVGGWARQDLGRRVSLTYLAGIAFARLDRRYDYSFSIRPLAGLAAPTIFPPSTTSTQVSYEVGPMAGIEAPVALTDHVRLVPGTRLVAVGGEWIVRPAIALAWTY